MLDIPTNRIPRTLLLKSGGDLFVALLSACLAFVALAPDAQGLVGATLPRYPTWGLAGSVFIFASSIVFAMASMGLYDPDLRAGPTSIFARTILSFVMTAALMAGLTAAFPDLSSESTNLSVCFACTFVVLLAGKVLERAYSGRTSMRRVLVLGAAEKATLVNRLRRRRDRRGIVVIGFVDLLDRPRFIRGSNIIEMKTPLPVFIEQNRIDELVLAFDDRRVNSSIPAQEILQCKANGVSIIDVCTFYERQIGKVHLGSTSTDSVALSDVYSGPLQRSARKRLLDVVLTSVVLFVAWPAMVAIAVAILIES